jgi:hypothetical protein
MQEGLTFLLVLTAFEREHVLLDSESNFFRSEPCERDRNLEAVLFETLDVAGGIGLVRSPLDFVESIEKAVKPDG